LLVAAGFLALIASKDVFDRGIRTWCSWRGLMFVYGLNAYRYAG